jgi:ribonuclease HI
MNKESIVHVYVDGSCKGKGNTKSAGLGISFPEFPQCNKALPLSGAQTNNRAEITAALYAIQFINAYFGDDTNIVLYTDSMILYNAMTVFWPVWERKNWNIPVEHIRLYQLIVSLRNTRRGKIVFVKLKSKSDGNIVADALAKKGTEMHANFNIQI